MNILRLQNRVKIPDQASALSLHDAIMIDYIFASMRMLQKCSKKTYTHVQNLVAKVTKLDGRPILRNENEFLEKEAVLILR